MLDSKTHKVLEKLTSMTKAMQYAKVNFYTLKNFIDSGKSYDGKYIATQINYKKKRIFKSIYLLQKKATLFGSSRPFIIEI